MVRNANKTRQPGFHIGYSLCIEADKVLRCLEERKKFELSVDYKQSMEHQRRNTATK